MKLIDRIARLERQHANPNATGPIRLSWIMAEAEGPIAGASAQVTACAAPSFEIEATGTDPDAVLADLREQVSARVSAGVALAMVTWRTAAT
jgi:hypothetical protein